VLTAFLTATADSLQHFFTNKRDSLHNSSTFLKTYCPDLPSPSRWSSLWAGLSSPPLLMVTGDPNHSAHCFGTVEIYFSDLPLGEILSEHYSTPPLTHAVLIFSTTQTVLGLNPPRALAIFRPLFLILVSFAPYLCAPIAVRHESVRFLLLLLGPNPPPISRRLGPPHPPPPPPIRDCAALPWSTLSIRSISPLFKQRPFSSFPGKVSWYYKYLIIGTSFLGSPLGRAWSNLVS